MATNLAIDPELLNRALEVGGEKTKKATVNRALREFIARREQERLLELFGKLDWDEDYDYKQERMRSRPAQHVPPARRAGRHRRRAARPALYPPRLGHAVNRPRFQPHRRLDAASTLARFVTSISFL